MCETFPIFGSRTANVSRKDCERFLSPKQQPSQKGTRYRSQKLPPFMRRNANSASKTGQYGFYGGDLATRTESFSRVWRRYWAFARRVWLSFFSVLLRLFGFSWAGPLGLADKRLSPPFIDRPAHHRYHSFTANEPFFVSTVQASTMKCDSFLLLGLLAR